ncbi:MAG: hypothetical protein IPM29_21530 [Planctomycetes bacterium]|nr:hypothetical protein [Planctomycetota bacterium]
MPTEPNRGPLPAGRGPTGLLAAGLGLAALVAGACTGEGDARRTASLEASSCMKCHNGAAEDDYAGPGIENPHPFPGADRLSCVQCHGGDPTGTDKESSHVPPPPAIGDRDKQRSDAFAFFNKLTLTGLDKLPDYEVNGRRWTSLDFLQFVNPGDLRVVVRGRSCGVCHEAHAELVDRSLLATEAGILAGATYAAGMENRVPESVGVDVDTAADVGFRAVADPDFRREAADVGAVLRLLEFPVHSVRGDQGPTAIDGNDDYLAAALAADIEADGRVRTDSPLARLYEEQVAFTCGNCHLGSAGANNRAGDFRSSGCSACHMPYSLGGRSLSQDPNVPKDEPRNPDAIDRGERAHVRAHRIVSRYRTLDSGVEVGGIDDLTCAGCHQGSNRTVMQYWGIRLDQNQDVRRGNQYPADPVAFRNTADDARLYDPVLRNRTFNGRNANQYLAFEDYDGDGRDDTPADVHAEAGLGCIDCHGSHDLHGGDVEHPEAELIRSRMEQATAIACESCHGTLESYATTIAGTALDGTPAQVAVDPDGRPLRHVLRDEQGRYWLTSKLDGRRHYVVQTRDTAVDTGVVHPVRQAALYSERASFAMGRADGDPATGIGPGQATPGQPLPGSRFCHSDTMSCASCHAAWTNTCVGCHLVGEFDRGNNFSNITGDRIVFREKNAEFVYQSPVPFQLGYGPDGRITQVSANTKVFFRYEDRDDRQSRVFAFADRNGGGRHPPVPGLGALGHNALLAHSIRGRVTETQEGPRYCTACHLTQDGLARHGADYDAFRTAMAAGEYGQLDFVLLQEHIGRNPGNQLDSPLWVHMVAGLGSGLFLFDENGCPVNPLDHSDQRFGCDNVPPSAVFDPQRAVLDLDRIVDENGVSRASSNHAWLDPVTGPTLRDGALDPELVGPLGATLIRKLTDPATGIVLDTWLDADGGWHRAR